MAGQQQLKRGEYDQGNSGGQPQADETKRHGREGKEAGLGGLAAGAVGLYEKHAGKKDPEHATTHKVEEGIAGTGAVGAEGFAYHEHNEKKDGKKEDHELKKQEKDSWFR